MFAAYYAIAFVAVALLVVANDWAVLWWVELGIALLGLGVCAYFYLRGSPPPPGMTQPAQRLTPDEKGIQFNLFDQTGAVRFRFFIPPSLAGPMLLPAWPLVSILVGGIVSYAIVR